MEFLLIAIVGLFLLVPLAFTVMGIALLANGVSNIVDSIKKMNR